MKKRLRKKLWLQKFLPMTFLLALLLVACTQQEAPAPPVVARQKPAPEKMYTYVEQMPELPGGGGMHAIINNFQKRVHLPKSAVEQGYDRAIVHFEVGPDGNVCHIKIIDSSNSPALDSSILTAVRAFPRFIPGRQNGKPVTVSFNLPVMICAQ